MEGENVRKTETFSIFARLKVKNTRYEISFG